MYSVVLYHPIAETYSYWKIAFSLIQLAEAILTIDTISKAYSDNYTICILDNIDIRNLNRNQKISQCKDYLKKEEEKYGRI